jgi:hypothetical protein
MKTIRVVAGGLIWIVIAVAGLSASSVQTGEQRPTRSVDAGQASETPAPVIRTLPPVTFGTAPAKTQPALRASADRLRAEALRALQSRMEHKTRTVCGLTMIEQSPDVDTGILLPPNDRAAGAAVRRIEPDVCTADSGQQTMTPIPPKGGNYRK